MSMFSIFFFFKQKTAFELLISDWSSDVCSSDLSAVRPASGGVATARGIGTVSAPARSLPCASGLGPDRRGRPTQKSPDEPVPDRRHCRQPSPRLVKPQAGDRPLPIGAFGLLVVASAVRRHAAVQPVRLLKPVGFRMSPQFLTRTH